MLLGTAVLNVLEVCFRNENTDSHLTLVRVTVQRLGLLLSQRKEKGLGGRSESSLLIHL